MRPYIKRQRTILHTNKIEGNCHCGSCCNHHRNVLHTDDGPAYIVNLNNDVFTIRNIYNQWDVKEQSAELNDTLGEKLSTFEKFQKLFADYLKKNKKMLEQMINSGYAKKTGNPVTSTIFTRLGANSILAVFIAELMNDINPEKKLEYK